MVMWIRLLNDLIFSAFLWSDSTAISVCLSVCLSVPLSVYLILFRFDSQSVKRYYCTPVHLPWILSACVSVCPSVCGSTSVVSLRLWFCPWSVCLSVCLFDSLCLVQPPPYQQTACFWLMSSRSLHFCWLQPLLVQFSSDYWRTRSPRLPFSFAPSSGSWTQTKEDETRLLIVLSQPWRPSILSLSCLLGIGWLDWPVQSLREPIRTTSD